MLALALVASMGAAASMREQAATQNTPRQLEVVWKAGGGDDAATSFSAITSIAVGPTGNIVVWDMSTPALRMYDSSGKLVRNIGRKGAGPGEWTEVNGLAFLPDGRLLEWDAGNARVNIYKPGGEPDRSWITPMSGTYRSDGLSVDPAGRAYMQITMWNADRTSYRPAWIRVTAATGAIIDTVLSPAMEGGDPPLMARSENGGTSSRNLPYGKSPIVALNLNGEVMWSLGDPYVINAKNRARDVQIKRAHTPVPVSSAERAELRAGVELNLRSRQPSWTWTGRDVPAVKPPVSGFASGLDGRIWVRLNVESERFTPEPQSGNRANSPPLTTFRDKERRWDVFEPDGRYVGTVTAARNVNLRVMRGNYAWGTMTDEDDLPVLVKFRITPAFQ